MIRCSTVVNSPQCYHGGGTQDVFHSRLFVFVNFGSTVNRFLIAYEPPAKEARVAESFIDNPQRFYSPAGGYESGYISTKIHVGIIDSFIGRSVAGIESDIGTETLKSSVFIGI